MPRILIVAGEASGDLYGAMLARALRARAPTADLVGAGSEQMRAAGVRILADPTTFASIGIVEALSHLRRFLDLRRTLQRALQQERPDVLVPIDFPDFNLPLAERAHGLGIPVVYYVSPTLWAWRPGRIHTIARVVRRMLVIFPFERELYERAGVPVTFVGHPLKDVVAERGPARDLRAELGIGPEAPLVGLLPGSRLKQYETLLPRMSAAAALVRREWPRARFAIAQAHTIPPGTPAPDGIPVVRDRIHDVLSAADALLTASGTATVEAALYGVPMVVTYWVHPLAALTLGPLLRVRDYAMVNILAGRRIMPELYQFKARPALLAGALSALLPLERRATLRWHLSLVAEALGPPGASGRAADEILRVARGG
jgi:lipid-A-disaccharide synthase